MSHNTASDSAQEGESSTTDNRSVRPWRPLPIWWWIVAATLIGLSFAVRQMDQASGRLAFAAAVVLAILIACVRCLWRPSARIAARVLPTATYLVLIAAVLACVRFDAFDGNMVPRRVSLRWQPAPDQRLASLAPNPSATSIDLGQTTPHDFPQFLGPHRNGVIDVELGTDWSSEPPELLWKKEAFGAGHSGFAAVNGYAVTLEQRGSEEIVSCYQIDTGELVWSRAVTARHETVPGGVGPRSTPTIHEGRVYTMGATGVLQCLDGASGELIWDKNLLDEIETTTDAEYNTIQWGRAASPIIDEGRLIIPLGLRADPTATEKGATLLALDAETGEERWRSGTYQISYASPVIANVAGVKQILQVCESEACGFDATTGQPLWEYPWPGDSAANASCSQAVPVDDHRILLSKAYAHGSALVDIQRDGDTWTAKKVWYKRVMKTKFTNALIYEDHIYGLDDGILSCVALETGERKWKRGRYGHGQVLRIAANLLIQAENGDVVLVQASPDAHSEVARFSAIEGRTWNNPCLYGKTLLVRNSRQAACYRLP